MDPEVVRNWKRGQEAANQFALEEARNRTVAERFALFLAFRARLKAMGRLPVRDDNMEFHRRWLEVQEAWLAKHGPVFPPSPSE